METANHDRTDYSEITSLIAVGTNFCCQVHFDEDLLRQGFHTDISLQEEQLDSPLGVKAYVWLPVKDHEAPTPYQFRVGVSVIAQAVKAREKVYVHCRNGHGRAPTLTAAYFVSQGMSVEEAVETVREKRPEIHLEESQMEALRAFQKTVWQRES